MTTSIGLIRSDSLGLKGTIRNAKHHAGVIIPFINALREGVKHVGFAEWKQGHNVHVFFTTDGRQFTLRPVHTDADGYVGVKFSLKLSRSEEIPLAVITDVSEATSLLTAMRLVARPHPVEKEPCKEVQ
jgi:hypothetical protein